MSLILLGTTFILVHEMDAIRCKEWKIFPGLSMLNDRTGMTIFIVAHVPLIYWVLTGILTGNASFRTGFDIFLIIHFFLHLLFLMHPENRFRDWISWSVISAAAACGIIDLLIR